MGATERRRRRRPPSQKARVPLSRSGVVGGERFERDSLSPLSNFLFQLSSRYFVVDDNDENDHQDHGIGTTGTVPAMTMSLSTSRSWLVLIPLSSSDQSPS